MTLHQFGQLLLLALIIILVIITVILIASPKPPHKDQPEKTDHPLML